ncbi:MAG: NAD+ synthase [Candidatus Omnitrophica bacterium]|nr:NAD+ synthase [Candidatus Omnitrophota bacterium]
MKKIRFAIAQMNPAVGDYKANTHKIITWIRASEKKKADLIVFPELALSGYPVWDLANKKHFVDEGLSHLGRIVRCTARMKIAVVLGFIDRGVSHDQRSRNTLAWIGKGKILAQYTKRLLPTYDVFLEDIFFEPGKESFAIPWKGWRVGLTICEDLWDDRYDEKPLAELKRRGANLILNISASPYYRGVAEARDLLLKRHTVRYGFPILYTNQVGGQDDLVFDGRSLFVDASGQILFRAPAFKEDLFFFDWDPRECDPYVVPLHPSTSKPEEVYEALLLGIRDYCRKNGFQKVLLGLSGGIDSALVAVLACDALGAQAVLGVTMPGTYSSRGSWEDSRELAKRLGIEFRIHPIKEKYEKLLEAYQDHKREEGGRIPPSGKITLAMENLQARLRGMELMYLSNDENRLLLSTGNKSELAMGYCTLYGDMAGGLCVLGDVYKTDVYRLAWYRNQKGKVIPDSILTKPPSAELRPNQKDEDSLPPYEILDEILYFYIEKNQGLDEIVRHFRKKVSHSLVANVIDKVDHNEYKRRQTPPILRVSEKAWFGRRMPITNRFGR